MWEEIDNHGKLENKNPHVVLFDVLLQYVPQTEALRGQSGQYDFVYRSRISG